MLDQCKHITVKLIGWLLLLQMINLSIDPPPPTLHKNVNETESISELISESVFDNDIPENEESDPERYMHSIDLYCMPLLDFSMESFDSRIKHFAVYFDRLLYRSPALLSPPPDIS